LNFALLNAFVGLIGYYFAAFTIDYKWMGRVRCQAMGFFIISLLFFICGLYTPLQEAGYVQSFEFIYLMTSFFQQFGPNVTTYILPIELFPTDVRVQAHGYCAAFGKVGALFGTLLFTYGGPNGTGMATTTIFIVCGALSFLGFLVTIAMVPEMSQTSLHDVDRRWSVDRHEMGAVIADLNVDEGGKAEKADPN